MKGEKMDKISKKKAVLGMLFSMALLGFFAISCEPTMQIVYPERPDIHFIKMPVRPIEPDPVLSSLEEVVNTPAIINRFKKGITPIKLGSTIGVMDFKSTLESGSGNLVADTFSIHLFRRGLGVVERQNIKKITEEQMMAAKGMQSLTDEDIAKRIGRITRADFIIFGAVTQYHFENRKLPIPYKIPREENIKYFKALKIYRQEAEQFLRSRERMDERYFKYMEEDLMAQMNKNDINQQLHYSVKGGRWQWDYKSARNLRWGYPYFASSKVLPIIGIRKKELNFNLKNLEQDVEAWKAIFQNDLEKYDRSVSQYDLQNVFNSWYQYNEKKKRGENFDDEYIRKVKYFIRDVVSKLREYIELSRKLKAHKLMPIPEKEGQFDVPATAERFVSIANLGITFKIIDVRTGEIVWIGQASKRDLNIQNGLNNMVNSVVNEILSR